MKIISSYHKKLHCLVGNKSIGIEPNQIMTVDDETGKVLIENPWIHVAIENVKPPTFMPCRISCKTEKPVEKKREERLAEKTEKLVEKKDETLKKNPIRKKTKVDKIN